MGLETHEAFVREAFGAPAILDLVAGLQVGGSGAGRVGRNGQLEGWCDGSGVECQATYGMEGLEGLLWWWGRNCPVWT
jgi:hypothetical protein